MEAEPEQPVEPETVVEPEATIEPEATMEPEVTMPEIAGVTTEMTVTEVVQENPIFMEPAFEEPPMLEATDKENVMNEIADAGKMPAAKQIGEQSAMQFSPVEGLAPKNVNLQPMDLA